MADHQTAGGYPVPAAVPRADLPRVAQLLPGRSIRFRLVTLTDAQSAWRKLRAALDSIKPG
jgi:allophanate hydrolase subunit 2